MKISWINVKRFLQDMGVDQLGQYPSEDVYVRALVKNLKELSTRLMKLTSTYAEYTE